MSFRSPQFARQFSRHVAIGYHNNSIFDRVLEWVLIDSKCTSLALSGLSLVVQNLVIFYFIFYFLLLL